MPSPDDNCVVLFYQGQRYWVGRVDSADEVPALGDHLRLLMSALKNGGPPPAGSLMGGVEK